MKDLTTIEAISPMLGEVKDKPKKEHFTKEESNHLPLVAVGLAALVLAIALLIKRKRK
ncbi:MAG: LPXTG cell wall anchor domain-containing protein [Clostridia bacterium]|nr:LPXTG cell wall anchor domain-containing protein [Clostridia bacterium]